MPTGEQYERHIWLAPGSGKPCLAEIIEAHDEKEDGQRSQKGRHPAGFFGFLFLCHNVCDAESLFITVIIAACSSER